MKRTRIEGLSYWGAFQPDRGIDFNGFHLAPGLVEGGLLVDPMPHAAEELRETGGARHIVLTNFDHLRAAAELKRELGSQVSAPRAERDRFGDHTDLVDHWFDSSDTLPAPLDQHVNVFPLRGGKSDGEVALYLPKCRALLFGDLVRSHESGTLRLLPPPKIRDLTAVQTSLAELAPLQVDALLLGDGDCIFNGAHKLWSDFVNELRG